MYYVTVRLYFLCDTMLYYIVSYHSRLSIQGLHISIYYMVYDLPRTTIVSWVHTWSATPNLPTNIIHTNIARVKLSGKSPTGLGIPPLTIKITLESNPLTSTMLVGGLGVSPKDSSKGDERFAPSMATDDQAACPNPVSTRLGYYNVLYYAML